MPSSGRTSVVTVLVTVTTLAAVAASGLLLLAWWRSDDVEGPVARDLAGNAVPFEAPDAAQARVRETGELFEAPEQGLSVPLLSAVAVDGVINPPGLQAAYLYRAYGDPHRAGSGVVVVAVHSVRGGEGPGNALAEPVSDGGVAAGVRVGVGDPILVGGVRYRVTRTEVRDKASIADDKSIWHGRDGLVVITCFPDPSVALSDQPNLVVRAERWER